MKLSANTPNSVMFRSHLMEVIVTEAAHRKEKEIKRYEKDVYTVMVINSTNINKANNQLTS